MRALFAETAQSPIQKMACGQNQRSGDNDWSLGPFINPKASRAGQGQRCREKQQDVIMSMVSVPQVKLLTAKMTEVATKIFSTPSPKRKPKPKTGNTPMSSGKTEHWIAHAIETVVPRESTHQAGPRPTHSCP
jgi:hypothetical protein